MYITKKEIVPLMVVFFMFVAAVSFYKAPCLPSQLPTHWNANGQIDGYAGKNFVLFFFPALTFGLYLLMTFLPLLDPLKKNYKDFALTYFFIRFILVLFFAFLYFYTLWAAIANPPKINYLIIPFMSLLFIVLGLAMPKIKKNYFVGIRTPWTLHSETVWNKTHKFGGFTFLAAGIVSFFSIFLGQFSFLFFILAISVGGLLPVVYSYIAFRNERGR